MASSLGRFDVYLRQAIENGKPVFPEAFVLTDEEYEKRKALNPEAAVESLQTIRRTNQAWKWCTPAETPILMADFTEKPIESVEPGDEVVGFSRKNEKFAKTRLQKSKVVRKFKLVGLVQEMTLASGRKVRCTPEHKWYTGRYERGRLLYAPALLGSELLFVCPTGEQTDPQQAAWAYLAGIFDGEGSTKSGGCLTIAQNKTVNGPVYDRIVETLNTLGIAWGQRERRSPDKRGYKNSPGNMLLWLKDSFSVAVKLIRVGCGKRHQLASRLIKHGAAFGKGWDRVVKIEPLSEQAVYALQTETGNYIAWGYASSNSGQYMNDPIDRDTVEFKTEWFRPVAEQHKRLFPVSKTILSLDPAFRLKQHNDYSGVVLSKVLPTNDVCVLVAEQYKLNPERLIFELFRLYEAFRFDLMILETAQAQLLMANLLRDEMKKRNCFFLIHEIAPGSTDNKAARIRGLIPHYANQRIYHASGLLDLEAQLTEFPRNSHDDIIDALAYQIEFWNAPQGEPQPKKETAEYSYEWWKKKAHRKPSQLKSLFQDLR